MSDVERQTLTSRLVRTVKRLARTITPSYVRSVVATDPMIVKARHVSTLLADALDRELLSRRTDEEMQHVSSGDLGAPSVPAGQASWTLRGCFTAHHIAKAATGVCASRIVGLVAGYPWFIQLEQKKSGAQQDGEEENEEGAGDVPTLVGVYAGPSWEANKTSNPKHGSFFTYSLEGACGTPVATRRGDGKPHWYAPGKCRGWGFHDFFSGKTWEDVFAGDLPYLSEAGELEVEVLITQSMGPLWA